MQIVARVTDESSFEESYVEDGCVQIDKLESKDLEGQIVLELDLRPMHF